MTKQRINNLAKENVKKKKIIKYLKIMLLAILIFLANIYMILSFIYEERSFTIYLEKDENSIEQNLTIYENSEKKIKKKFLKAKGLEKFSTYSLEWLPEEIYKESEGSHNGNNYIAYTFYVENQGHEEVNYETTINIEDVVKNLDEVLRVVVYKNDEKTVYAKQSKLTGESELGTTPFTNENTVMTNKIEKFKVGDIDKYTIIIFIEGTDQDCTDALIGGEIRMNMKLKEEKISKSEEVEKNN